MRESVIWTNCRKPGRKPRRAFACAFAPCMAQLRERFRGKATRARSMERTNESSFVGSSDCDSVPTLLFPCYFREISANYLAVSAACAILHLTHPPLQEFTGGGVELHPIAETRKLQQRWNHPPLWLPPDLILDLIRGCPGHPRLDYSTEDVDARGKPGQARA